MQSLRVFLFHFRLVFHTRPLKTLNLRELVYCPFDPLAPGVLIPFQLFFCCGNIEMSHAI